MSDTGGDDYTLEALRAGDGDAWMAVLRCLDGFGEALPLESGPEVVTDGAGGGQH